MSPGLQALLGLLLVVGSLAAYWPRIRRVDVPLRPWGHWAAKGVGMALALAALVQGTGLLGGTAAVLSLVLGATFLFFTLASTMPDSGPGVAVGDRFLDFTAPDADGQPVALSSLLGRPILLKFFRGHW